jgi:hypothetical protein
MSSGRASFWILITLVNLLREMVETGIYFSLIWVAKTLILARTVPLVAGLLTFITGTLSALGNMGNALVLSSEKFFLFALRTPARRIGNAGGSLEKSSSEC